MREERGGKGRGEERGEGRKGERGLFFPTETTKYLTVLVLPHLTLGRSGREGYTGVLLDSPLHGDKPSVLPLTQPAEPP